MRSLVHSVILAALVAPLASLAAACSDDDAAPAPATDGGAGSDSSVTGGGDAAPGDAATGETSTTQDGGKKPFGEKCEGDGDCESGVCFVGGKQSYCTMKCTVANAATDCPKPPTTGECNNMGFCKK